MLNLRLFRSFMFLTWIITRLTWITNRLIIININVWFFQSLSIIYIYSQNFSSKILQRFSAKRRLSFAVFLNRCSCSFSNQHSASTFLWRVEKIIWKSINRWLFEAFQSFLKFFLHIILENDYQKDYQKILRWLVEMTTFDFLINLFFEDVFREAFRAVSRFLFIVYDLLSSTIKWKSIFLSFFDECSWSRLWIFA
jgi:hypothetical protein